MIKIIQYSIFSLIIIAIFHYLFSFLKDNLTTPKIKDLIDKPTEKYEQIMNTIIENNNKNNIINEDKMKEDLKTYINTLNNSSNNDGTTNLDDLSQTQNQTNQNMNYNNYNNYNDNNDNLEEFNFQDSNNDELAYSFY